MAAATEFRIVLVTCGSRSEARKLAKAVVGKRLAACVNIVEAPAESIYWWKGKVEGASETLLIMKTVARRIRDLEREVRRLHSYEVPEFLVLKIGGGSKEYLQWLKKAVR